MNGFLLGMLTGGLAVFAWSAEPLRRATDMPAPRQGRTGKEPDGGADGRGYHGLAASRTAAREAAP